ncbi:sensor histidine kinase [Natribacillus halophilus]|uniref:histidine kinase n=1 Tax=Natribacillus halophilus TaxID=549003 RepID=A0A1G8RDP9_9BACI|nr:HAMP domain-containing sensor histidine kinase [Natribacillus halophilus]SDJ15184.1 Signal transduction histidine kinase [Natribacillus halophilus]
MNRIFYKLSGSIMILFLIVLLPLGYVMIQIFTNYNEVHLYEETEEMASQYATLLAVVDDPDIEPLVQSMDRETARKMVIIDPNGNVVEDSGIHGFHPSDHSTSQGEAGKFIDPNDRQEYIYAGERVQNDDIGEVFIFSPSDLMDESAIQVQHALLLSGVGALLLAFGFTFIASREFSTPLQEMERAANQMAMGDLDVEVPVKTKDELGSLSHSMNELARELKRYRSNRQAFFSDVSHELRTPLSYVQGYCDALKRELYQDETERQQFVDIIHEEAHRMNRLIHDLFELSRMEEERFPLNLELVHIEDVIRRAKAKIVTEAKKKNNTIKVDMEAKLPMIVADSFRLEQIFTNLLQNAVSYTGNGHVWIEASMKGRDIEVKIADTGRGIAPEDLPYIFERFYRAEKSRARDFGGTGLGLAIVKQLTELQYGSIQVKSVPGKGTTFTLRFPEAKEGDE